MARKTAQRNAPDLHVHSGYSLLDGTGSPLDVVKRAKELKWGAAALTEHGWLGSTPPFYKACVEHKIKPILGCELYVVAPDILGVKNNEVRSATRHLTVLAISKEGYQNLVTWNNIGMQPENFYYRPRISVEAMIESAPWPLHHNVVLSGCAGGELCTSLATMNGNALTAGKAYIESMKSVFPNFYVEVQNHRHEKFMGRGFTAYEEMIEREEMLREMLTILAFSTGTPLVVTNDSHFQRQEQRKAHIAMMASKLKRWSKGEDHRGDSQEREIKEYVRDYGYWRNFMQPMEDIADKCKQGDEMIGNLHDIVAASDVHLDALDKFTYSIPFSGYDKSLDEIRRRCKSRLKSLVRKHGDMARERFEHELRAMGGFGHYLLMMSDFITHAKREGILTNTRGSAANSIVCYCLKIHDIDSIHYKLTFERFVNPERKKLPDIDIDIDKDRHEDFMRYVLDYMAEREAEGGVVQIGNYQTLANRSTFRLVAEGLGIPKEVQDEIADLLPQMIDSGLVDEGDDVYATLKDNYPEIYELASGVFDNLKGVSQHACGWLFGTADRPISEWVPLYWIASSSTLVTAYDYKALEDFGLTKGDFLRLKTLSVISRCLKMLGKNPLDLQQIPLDDPDTFEMLRAGHTEGIFTLQGKTNRQGVMEVEATNEHDVIASVAIYRPALTRPGYHHVYNRRRRGEEYVTYPHAVAESVLGESFGLPIFQEQILDLGYAVGMDHVEAQELLDAIKKAKGVGRGAKEAFANVEPKFIKRAMKTHGMTRDEAEGVWELVASFQGYGFNRGHATSYGTLAVRAAYLKCHHPQEFYTSLLDVYPEKHKYVAGARSEGFRLLPPDINLSGAGFTKGSDDRSIRVGLARVHGVGPVALRSILAAQPFSSLDDLRERTPKNAVDKTVVENLGAVGALKSLGVKASADDTEMLRLLGFLLDKPRAMKDIKLPKIAKRESDSGWRHAGYQHGVELADMKQSVSKMFWVPELPDKDLLKLKASPWARVKTYLLLVVDENGLPFTIKANEDKPERVAYLKWMIKKCKGGVICMDGMITKPFDIDGPLGFTFLDVTGTFNGQPLAWNVEDDVVTGFNVLHKRKRATSHGRRK